MKRDFLVTGAGGQLGSVLMRRLSRAGRSALGLTSLTGPRPDHGETQPVDLLDADGLAAVVRTTQPACIVHAAAMTVVGACFDRPADAERINVDVTRQLAELASEWNGRLVFVSTDLVFDGQQGSYDESAEARPTTMYGRTKFAAERVVLGFSGGAVVRLPLMYGLPAAPRSTTFLTQLAALKSGAPLKLFRDEFRSPIWLEDAAAALQSVADAAFAGPIHAGGPQRLSRLEMGRIAAAGLGLSGASIVETSQRDLPATEPRPADVSLRSERFAETFGEPAGRRMAEAMIEIKRQHT